MAENDASEGKDEASTLSEITGAIATVFGHWPVAITKNLSKAVGYLLIVPKTALEVWASEKKAASDARNLITKATGKALAKGVEKSIEHDTYLIDLAKATHTNKILRQQKNVANIVHIAMEEIEKKQLASTTTPASAAAAPCAEEDKEISEDWLNAYESEAVNMSSEHMQILFGKILAGEINKPSSFSIRTLKLMGQLDAHIASLFQRLCSLSCTLYYTPINVIPNPLEIADCRVISLGAPAGANGLSPFGINFNDLNDLADHGLIIPEFNSQITYGGGMFSDHFVSSPIDYMDHTYNLISKDPNPNFPKNVLQFYGVQLSRAGKELLRIVEKRENENYTAALKGFLDKQGLSFQSLSEWVDTNMTKSDTGSYYKK